MSEEFSVEWPNDGARLGGRLTFATCAAVYRELERRGLERAVEGPVDLSGLSRVDSAGLALLLEWQARQQSAGRRLRLDRAPDSLLRLAQLANATELLGLSGRDGTDP